MPETIYQNRYYHVTDPQLLAIHKAQEQNTWPHLSAEEKVFVILSRVRDGVMPEPPNPEGRYYWGASSRNVSIPYRTRYEAEATCEAWNEMEFPREVELQYRGVTVKWYRK